MKKSMTTGAIIGLLLTLALLYPTINLLVAPNLPPLEPGIQPQSQPGAQPQPQPAPPPNPQPQPGGFNLQGGVLHVLVLLASANMATLIFLMIGSVAAWRARATTVVDGVHAGVVSGGVAGLALYIMLIAPTTAVLAGRDLLNYNFPANAVHFPNVLITEFVRQVMRPYDFFVLLACMVIGGLQGSLVGWLRRRAAPPPRPTLLEILDARHGRRTWFKAYADEAIKAGLIAGLMGGLLIAFSDMSGLSASNTGAIQFDQWTQGVLQQALANTPWGKVAGSPLSSVLGPFAFLATIGVGGLAAFLPKNPPRRFGTRMYAAMIAGTTVGLITSIEFMQQVYFGIALLPQWLLPLLNQPGIKIELGNAPVLMILTHILSAAPMRELMIRFLSTAEARALLIYVLPLPFITLWLVLCTVIGTLQGIFYSLLLMPFRFRPVDRARAIWRDIRQRGDQFLPRLYRVFQTDRCAMQTLEHLAFDLRRDPAKAHVVAAYHTLAMRPDRAADALDVTSRTLGEQPAWKMRSEVSALHSLMAKGLRAGTVAQIAAIQPMPEDQTTSLPPLLAKAGEHLTRTLNELKKIERVDDLNSKIIFLNNSLESLRLAQVFVEEGSAGGDRCSTALPEFNVLCGLLDRWDEIVLSKVKNLQGRAEPDAELKTRKLTFAPRLALDIVLSNHGLNVAENVHLLVDDCPEQYEVLDGQQQCIEILPPQESRELSFVIRPRGNLRRLRVCWQVMYDDALNKNRTLEFGDLVEFIEAEKPFQRIFPIPYVTGTPLQSGQMFVGRQDVFDFVREHLLGKYQNNVIVLHGQRRTGKTSVLYRLGDMLADTHMGVLVDMQGKAARGEVDFLYSIADDIAYTLENKGIKVNLPPRQEFEESPEFFFRSRFLRGAYDALGGKNLLLMFDEFEELQKRVEDGKLTADIFPYLRNLMQHERKVDFVFAGTHKLEELAAEYWSILFNIAAYKKITFLAKDDVERLVTQPVAPYGLEFDPLAIERIYQVAAGHPYFTQVVCHELVAYHNETQRSYLTTTDVDAALGRILERGEAHFKYIWAESSTQQRLTLLALAELLETGDAATPDDVAGMLRKRGRPLDGQDLPEALGNLESRDILMRADPRSSLYRFRVDLIRRWIYATRPAYEKVV